MSTDITVAAIAFLGTILGSGGGILASSKLVNHRIKQLEDKVSEHNSIIRRTFVLEEQMKVANHRIADVEVEIKKR